MSKIIVLVGSVRKNGNTELLADAFYKGAIQNNDVEVISVADYKVNPCIGCNSCFEREGNRCFQQDDMEKIYNKLALLLVAAADLSEVFDAIKTQYKLVLNFFHLEDAGMVLVRRVKDKGDIKNNMALTDAFKLGDSLR